MWKFATLRGLAGLVPALGEPAVVGPHGETPQEAAALHSKLAGRVPPRLQPRINE